MRTVRVSVSPKRAREIKREQYLGKVIRYLLAERRNIDRQIARFKKSNSQEIVKQYEETIRLQEEARAKKLLKSRLKSPVATKTAPENS